MAIYKVTNSSEAHLQLLLCGRKEEYVFQCSDAGNKVFDIDPRDKQYPERF